MKAIICAGENGRALIYGDVTKLPEADEKVTIKNARMIIRFAGGGLFALAAIGPQKGQDNRITSTVAKTTCTARQAITVTAEAAKAIDSWPNYQ